jgi:hypothetical protein
MGFTVRSLPCDRSGTHDQRGPRRSLLSGRADILRDYLRFTIGYSTPHFLQRKMFSTFSTALCIGASNVSPPHSGQFGSGSMIKSFGRVSDMTDLLCCLRAGNSLRLWVGELVRMNVRKQRGTHQSVPRKNRQNLRVDEEPGNAPGAKASLSSRPTTRPRAAGIQEIRLFAFTALKGVSDRCAG